MWTSSFKQQRESVEECEHDKVNITSFAGLQRTVCGNCGHVSVGYLHDTFQELTKQLQTVED